MEVKVGEALHEVMQRNSGVMATYLHIHSWTMFFVFITNQKQVMSSKLNTVKPGN